MNPKLFLRIRRFCRALDKIQTESVHKLSDLAYDCGFSDQAHLIREFSQFMGEPPKTYLRRGQQLIVQFPDAAMIGSVMKHPGP